MRPSVDRGQGNAACVRAFAACIDKAIARGRTESLVTNLTFFTGSGFSNAWDKSFPLGNDLFCLDGDLLFKASDFGCQVLGHACTRFDTIAFGLLKDIIYKISMELKYPAIRGRYSDANNLGIMLEAIKKEIHKKFIRTAAEAYVEAASDRFAPARPSRNQETILRFFRYLLRRANEAAADVEGLQVNFVSTNYDFVIETICDRILDDPEDSPFLHLYRGITPYRIGSADNPRALRHDRMVWNLIKLNGGFEIFEDERGYVFDYTKKERYPESGQAPIIMLPSREQNYQERYFSAIFPKAVKLLQDSDILVIVGYGMPEEDALLQFLINKFAENEKDFASKRLFYIDTVKNAEKKRKILSCFPYAGAIDDFEEHVSFYQGSFGAWAAAVAKRFPA